MCKDSVKKILKTAEHIERGGGGDRWLIITCPRASSMVIDL